MKTPTLGNQRNRIMTDKIILRYGANNQTDVALEFDDAMDAIGRFSEQVVRLDRDSDAWAAWAALDAPGGGSANWTKVSNERPTSEGRPLQ